MGPVLLLGRATFRCCCWPFIFTRSPGFPMQEAQVYLFCHLWKFSDLRNYLFGLGAEPLLPARYELLELPVRAGGGRAKKAEGTGEEGGTLAMRLSREDKLFSKIPVEREFSRPQVKI